MADSHVGGAPAYFSEIPEKFYTNLTGIGVFAAMAVFLGLSIFNPDFQKIVTKPDNVPIVGMLFLVPFFTWFSLREAVRNDKRTEGGQQLIEQEETAEKVLTWPDLVYTELICMVVLTVVLIGWSLLCRLRLKTRQIPVRRRSRRRRPGTSSDCAGNARVLRSVARRRAIPWIDHCGPWCDSLYRHQSKGQRLLHAERAEVGDRHVPVLDSLFFVFCWWCWAPSFAVPTGTSSGLTNTGTFTNSKRWLTSTCPNTSGEAPAYGTPIEPADS
jgi:hypothetical protein